MPDKGLVDLILEPVKLRLPAGHPSRFVLADAGENGVATPSAAEVKCVISTTSVGSNAFEKEQLLGDGPAVATMVRLPSHPLPPKSSKSSRTSQMNCMQLSQLSRVDNMDG
jgi:hypothetical protein